MVVFARLNSDARISYMRKSFVIIGAGEMGRAIGERIAGAGANVVWWDKDESKVPKQLSLEKTIRSGEIILLCIPSWALRNSLEEIEPFLLKEVLVLAVAKGLEQKTGLTMDKILDEVLGEHAHGLWYGPMLAEEIVAGMPARGVVATKSIEWQEPLKDSLAGSGLMISMTEDTIGVALCGVLKNMYAVGLGLIDGLNLGSNFRGWYVTYALQEMRRVIGLLGGQTQTAEGLSGVGDLIATGFSTCSANFMVGREVAEHGEAQSKSEGLVALPILAEQLGDQMDELVLLGAVRDALAGHNPRQVLIAAMEQTN